MFLHMRDTIPDVSTLQYILACSGEHTIFFQKIHIISAQEF